MRRMRVIPWRELSTNRPMATLVMEWFDGNGNITTDQRFQMDTGEFEGLAESVAVAASDLGIRK